MAYLFETFDGWKKYCNDNNCSLVDSVIDYEISENGATKEAILDGVAKIIR